MPELDSYRYCKVKKWKNWVVLGNKNSNNHLAIYTNNTTCVSCEEYLSNYESNRHNNDRTLTLSKYGNQILKGNVL